MLDPNNIDFKELGFHAGLEVHHQLRSSRKLFCNCPPVLEEDPENMDYSFYRYFRPVLGEMGDFDPGMLVEFEKGYKVIYFATEKNTCTYEMDETPPFPPDPEAIRMGYLLAAYFNCSAFADEIVVNRKQYLDGSITTGFQRTFICGRDGWVPLSNDKKVRITNVHVEEDAARRVNWTDTSSRTVYFNLDRLGVPLTEVITDYRDVDTPEELIETAKQIGRVLRISKIGRRGIGSVRQDVNISIKSGNRVEIKGVQELELFELLCRHEVVRQHSLIEISKEMKKRGLTKEDFVHTYIDVSHHFDLSEGEKAFVTVFPRMKGLFGVEVQPNKDFGEEIFEKSMLITGIPREYHFHSDEIEENAVRKRSSHPCTLPLDEQKIDAIRNSLQIRNEDAFVLVVGPERRALHALKKIVERVKIALDGVPQETRRLLPNGNTEFLRVIHGKERIYPDTDTPPIAFTPEEIEKFKEGLGIRPWEFYAEVHEKYGFNQEQVDMLIRMEHVEQFLYYTQNLKLDGKLAYYLLVELPREYNRKGIKLSEENINLIAEGLANKNFARRHIEKVIEIITKHPEVNAEELTKRLNLQKVNMEKVKAKLEEKLGSYDKVKLIREKQYQKHFTPKIIYAVLKDFDQTPLEGKDVLNLLNEMLGDNNE
ncbi:MAG: Glu-tRNA(Gln) amidotransferase subunit GatE [Candidatus Heimdallarchaeaceae archaeon]